MKLKAGVALGTYRIVAELGRGGMGAVYKAYQPSLDRFVAIKVLPTFFAEDERLRARFKREAVTIAQLTHPAILPVYEYGEKGLRPYIVMALAEGGSLAAQAREPLSMEAVVKLLAPLADALDYAHKRGVLHRDVKPANVLLQWDGRPLLSDFGLARSVDTDTRLTETGAALGTPDYMAPELWRGEPAGPASDQYSLAVMCHELLTGRLPFPTSTVGAPRGAKTVRHPDLSQAPSYSRDALARALATSPRDRFPTCADFIQALLPGPGVPRRRRARLLQQRRTRLLAVGIAITLAVLIVAALVAIRPPPPPPHRTGPLTVSEVAGLVGLKSPSALAVGADGSLYIADTGNNLVKKVDPAGTVTVFAGGGLFATTTTPVDATEVALHSPSGVAVDSIGDLFISDTGTNRILVVDPDGRIRVYAGDGRAGSLGDGGPATSAELSAPSGLAVQRAVNLQYGDRPQSWLWIIDQGNGRLRRILTDETIESPGIYSVNAGFLDPMLDLSGGIAFPPNLTLSNLYLSSSRGNRLFRWVSSCPGSWPAVATRSIFFCMRGIAGTGEGGFKGDNGVATNTTLDHPSGIAVNVDGDLYVADTGNGRVRLVDHAGTISTIVGGGSNPHATKPDQIQLNGPQAVALGPDGTLYIADTGNNRILKLTP